MQKFIELQKLRYPTTLQIELKTPSIIAPKILITPFILNTLVENAFKHVSSDKKDDIWIKVKIDLCDNDFDITCSNSCAYQVVPVENQGGIGLKNIQRRLELLYKDKHQLKIQKEPHKFIVHIKMTLDTQERAASNSLATTWN